MRKPMIHLMSGLPRAGSTLLANILAQNPEMHVSPTSGILDVMFSVRNNWNNITEFRANPNPGGRQRVLRGILESYYSDVEKPVVLDRCRSWLAHLEMAEAILGRKARVIVPVRDPRDVLASLEKLHRTTSATAQSPHEAGRYIEFQTVQQRCQFWSRQDQLAGIAYLRMKDALARGLRDRMHFVPYDRLCSEPAQTLRGIYKFLEMASFDHDFEDVEQLISEDDNAYGFAGLHTIRQKIAPQAPQWPSVLGEEVASAYKDLCFWEKL